MLDTCGGRYLPSHQAYDRASFGRCADSGRGNRRADGGAGQRVDRRCDRQRRPDLDDQEAQPEHDLPARSVHRGPRQRRTHHRRQHGDPAGYLPAQDRQPPARGCDHQGHPAGHVAHRHQLRRLGLGAAHHPDGQPADRQPQAARHADQYGGQLRQVRAFTQSLDGRFHTTGTGPGTSDDYWETGIYTIPRFSNCGFLTTDIINLAIPGPGNTASVHFTR